MKIDIGCGSNKEAGYLGIDRIAGPVVDIVCDICQEIPLPDNSAEFVMASRVLPYVDNLFAAMAEIHRISIHKAVVCILAPYAHSFAHMSNPSFKQKFDEYTPAFYRILLPTPIRSSMPSYSRLPCTRTTLRLSVAADGVILSTPL